MAGQPTRAAARFAHLQAEFKPVVQLDEVETATGEEDEEALVEMWVLPVFGQLAACV